MYYYKLQLMEPSLCYVSSLQMLNALAAFAKTGVQESVSILRFTSAARKHSPVTAPSAEI
jgi:hypothetical protein